MTVTAASHDTSNPPIYTYTLAIYICTPKAPEGVGIGVQSLQYVTSEPTPVFNCQPTVNKFTSTNAYHVVGFSFLLAGETLTTIYADVSPNLWG